MADQGQGALVHEMLGRFIDEAVSKAVEVRIGSLTEMAERHIEEIVHKGAATLAQAMENTNTEIQTSIHKMVEQGIRSLTTEAESIVERTGHRINELSAKILDDMPVTLQETLMQMTHENEVMFQRRAAEWMEQFRAEQGADINVALQAQFEAVRRSMLEEVTQSAKGICDRNLFDFRSEFENHVSRSFQSIAERLVSPIPDFATPPSPQLPQ